MPHTFVQIPAPNVFQNSLCPVQICIRSTMESVSVSYADMSVQVSDIRSFVLLNNSVLNGYYIRSMIITIITRGQWVTYRSPEQLVLCHSISKRFV